MSKEKGQTQNEGGRESLFEGTLSPHTRAYCRLVDLYLLVCLNKRGLCEQESVQQRRLQHSAFIYNLDTVHDHKHGLRAGLWGTWGSSREHRIE